MSGAIGRAVEVLSTGGGLSVKRHQQIQCEGFYVFGFFSLVFAVLKLTIEVHWSWWRVLLPLWVFLGHNLLHVLVGFIYLFFVKWGRGGRGRVHHCRDQRPDELPAWRDAVFSHLHG